MPIRLKFFKTDETGSLAPLGIGLSLVSLSTVVAVLASGSLYLTERRLTSLAESTALAVLVAPTPQSPKQLNSLAGKFIAKHSSPGLGVVQLVEASVIDSRTIRVRLCNTSKPIFETYIFSDVGRVCSEGLARRGK